MDSQRSRPDSSSHSPPPRSSTRPARPSDSSRQGRRTAASTHSTSQVSGTVAGRAGRRPPAWTVSICEANAIQSFRARSTSALGRTCRRTSCPEACRCRERRSDPSRFAPASLWRLVRSSTRPGGVSSHRYRWSNAPLLPGTAQMNPWSVRASGVPEQEAGRGVKILKSLVSHLGQTFERARTRLDRQDGGVVHEY